MSRGLAFLAIAIVLLVAMPRTASAQEASLAPPADVSRFLGQVIVRVEVKIDDDAWPDIHPPAVTSVRQNEPFSQAVARRALDEVMATGLFGRGRVVAVAEDTGVRLVVHVSSRKIVEKLSIDVHDAPVDRDEILREGDLSEGGEILGERLESQKKRIEALFVKHGFPKPEATITTRTTDDRQRVTVIVDVQPGAPRLIAKRFFYITDVELKHLEQLAASEYAVGKNERADEYLLDAADQSLEALLRGRGYHHADVWHDVVEWQGKTALRVRIDTGPRYEPRFEGNERFDESALTAALDLLNEQDRSPQHLVQKVQAFYASRGYLDVEVSMETRGGDADRVRQLVFKIAEHRTVKVIKRSYPCLKLDDIKQLSGGGPRDASGIGNEIDSYLEEELPGADLVKDPDPEGLDRAIRTGKEDLPPGARVIPADLDPNGVFVPDTYEKALQHVQELYRNEGFLHAQVGPAQVLRRRCHPRSPAGRCVPLEPPVARPDVCTYDASNLPLPVAPLDAALTCTPDPAKGIECESRIELAIPIKLGPRTTLYEIGFTGVRTFSEKALSNAANVGLGEPVNMLRLDDARRRILEMYREEGYAFADVKYALESSPDNTRGRVKFEIIEGDQVVVRDIVIVGNHNTNAGIIRRRISLTNGAVYRASEVRKTQERIATLNVFSSVSVGLSEPYVPQKYKTVIVTVNESAPQWPVLTTGFSTGEGVILGLEYTQPNLFGNAINLTLRARMSYLPTAFILDDQVRTSWSTLDLEQRLPMRLSGSLAFPETGLGPLFRSQLDAVFVRDLQRDFWIQKVAAVPSIQFRPVRQVIFTLAPSVEDNLVRLFNYASTQDYLLSIAQNNGGVIPTALSKYLLMPDGATYAVSQRFVVSWDRRDDSFNAHRGTYFLSGLEHVDWYPVNSSVDNVTTFEGHFLRFTETFAGYIPLPAGIRIAAEVRVGTNVQLTPTSQTYPDRLFFMGGTDSMRGWNLSSFVPQDDVDQIRADYNKPECVGQLDGGTLPVACTAGGAKPNPDKFTLAKQTVRGGNLMFNPKLELRIPIAGPVETVLFADVGNLWRRASYPLDTGRFPLRASAGSGLRIQTPVGPLALDYGINLTRDRVYAAEDFGAFHLAFGVF